MTTTTPAHPDQQHPTEPEHDLQTPLNQSVSDSTELARTGDEPDLAAILDNIVADEAPRLFAIVQQDCDRLDARIAAWGLAFDDHAEVVSVTPGMRGSLHTPEDALHLFDQDNHARPRLVWFNPNAATPAEDKGA